VTEESAGSVFGSLFGGLGPSFRLLDQALGDDRHMRTTELEYLRRNEMRGWKTRILT